MEEERTYPVDCECGKEALSNEYAYTKHIESKVHENAMLQRGYVKDDNGELTELPDDLKAIVAMKQEDPMMIGKMLRYAFAKRGWPNRHHLGTVGDFMTEHKLPSFDLPRVKFGQAEGDQMRRNEIQEYINANV